MQIIRSQLALNVLAQLHSCLDLASWTPHLTEVLIFVCADLGRMTNDHQPTLHLSSNVSSGCFSLCLTHAVTASPD